ncbi:MAG: hypothetical protein ACPHAS_10075 [Synechococcus sp.]
MPVSIARPVVKRDQQMLWIHAGPHKAASSYVTERLRKNRAALASQGVLMDGDDNRLANAIAQKNYDPVEQAMATLPEGLNRVLISSSSLDTRILKKSVLTTLRDRAAVHGFKLGVSYCIRDQQSWLNSVYCHRIRRFRETPDFPDYCDYIINDRDSWDIAYPSKFKAFKVFPEITTLFLPLSKRVAITDPFLALVDALDLDDPQGGQGWLKGEPSKQNIQPGAKGIWMSRLCRNLVVELGVDPERLERKGKVIRDLAIELGWDRDKFDGFDQPLLDHVAGFYQASNEAFAQEHWGVSWQELFPQKPAAPSVYPGPLTDGDRVQMRRWMVRVIRELNLPWLLRRRFFRLYDAVVA